MWIFVVAILLCVAMFFSTWIYKRIRFNECMEEQNNLYNCQSYIDQ